MRIKKESYLPGFNFKADSIAHGGDLRRGKRKIIRPIDPKQAIHVVMRSSRACGRYSLLHPKHCNRIHAFTEKIALRWGVRVYRFANVGNHIHLLVKVQNRGAWKRFIRELAGGIPQIVTGATKGRGLGRREDMDIAESAKRGFWDGLVFTRIVHFGRDFEKVARYLIKNLFGAAGVPVKKLFALGYSIMSLGVEPT